jgi:hypothetical protein
MQQGSREALLGRFGIGFLGQNTFWLVYFLVSLVFFILVILCGTASLATHWKQMDEGARSLFLIIVQGRSIGCFWSGIVRLRQLRKASSLEELETNSISASAIDIAARAILDDLFYTFVVQLVVVYLVGILLQR